MKYLTFVSKKIKPISIPIIIILSFTYLTCLTWAINQPTNSNYTRNDQAHGNRIISLGNVTKDSDNDGLTDEEEEYYGTNPYLWDTDGDSLSDWYEVYALHTDPVNSDTDHDGLIDSDEIYEIGSDPVNSDSDDDGIFDGKEIEIGTNPCVKDTDGDGLDDLWEVNHDFNPLKNDKWVLDLQTFVLPSILVIIGLIGGIVGSIQVKKRYWNSDTWQQSNTKSTQEILYDFLCNLPENQTLSLQECSELLCCSQNELLSLILSLFQPSEFPIMDKTSLKEIIMIRCFSEDHYTEDNDDSYWDYLDKDYLFVLQKELIHSGYIPTVNHFSVLMI